jgi:hypothetical protein
VLPPPPTPVVPPVEAELPVAPEETVASGAAEAVPNWTAPVEPLAEFPPPIWTTPVESLAVLLPPAMPLEPPEEAEPTPSTDAAVVGETFTPPTWTTPADESAELLPRVTPEEPPSAADTPRPSFCTCAAGAAWSEPTWTAPTDFDEVEPPPACTTPSESVELGTPLFGTPARAPTENLVPNTSMLSCGLRVSETIRSVRAPASSRTSSPSCPTTSTPESMSCCNATAPLTPGVIPAGRSCLTRSRRKTVAEPGTVFNEERSTPSVSPRTCLPLADTVCDARGPAFVETVTVPFVGRTAIAPVEPLVEFPLPIWTEPTELREDVAPSPPIVASAAVPAVPFAVPDVLPWLRLTCAPPTERVADVPPPAWTTPPDCEAWFPPCCPTVAPTPPAASPAGVPATVSAGATVAGPTWTTPTDWLELLPSPVVSTGSPALGTVTGGAGRPCACAAATHIANAVPASARAPITWFLRDPSIFCPSFLFLHAPQKRIAPIHATANKQRVRGLKRCGSEGRV